MRKDDGAAAKASPQLLIELHLLNEWSLLRHQQKDDIRIKERQQQQQQQLVGRCGQTLLSIKIGGMLAACPVRASLLSQPSNLLSACLGLAMCVIVIFGILIEAIGHWHCRC